MPSESPFALSRASVEDMVEICDLEYACFPPPIRRIFMGCYTKDDLPKIRKKYIESMAQDMRDLWIKVVDKQTGKVIAASNYKLYLHGARPGEVADSAPEWLEPEDFKESESILVKWNEVRARSMPGPFLHLHICFTDEQYRRRGAGAMMLQWGCDLADLLGLPGWIEASEDGNKLYKTFGFYEFEKIDIEGEVSGVNMKRDAKAVALAGGKSKP